MIKHMTMVEGSLQGCKSIWASGTSVFEVYLKSKRWVERKPEMCLCVGTIPSRVKYLAEVKA